MQTIAEIAQDACGGLRRRPTPRPALGRLPRRLSFAGSALSFAALYVAAGAPTPLLVSLQRQWGFKSGALTLAFAAYAFGLLAALLVVGSLSDHVGRRPVLVAALTVALAAMVLFVIAPSIGWIVVARIVQGGATGAATSAYTAALVELAPPGRERLGAIIASAAPAGGLGVGAVLTGAAIQFTSHPRAIVFIALAMIMALGIAVALLSAETAAHRPGALRSLIPELVVPRSARRAFAAAVPVLLASWMYGGLFLGLSPTILRELLHLHSSLLDGATASLSPLPAALISVYLGSRWSTHRTTMLGLACVIAGTVIVIAAIESDGLALLWIGGATGGVGFGACLSGALRSLTPLAQPRERAGLFAGVYAIAYLGFGVPAIIAGQLIGHLGLQRVVLGYAAAIVLASLLGLVAQRRLSQ